MKKQALVKRNASKSALKNKSNLRSLKADPIVKHNPRCTTCSGYEEKLSVLETTLVKEEIALMNKHEIIRQIASYFGADITSLSRAEQVFDRFRYMIAEHVLKHEFNNESRLSVQMVMWLEQKKEPAALRPLHQMIEQYLRK